MTDKKVGPRKKPCPTCPYRLDVPSGLWAESEYDKLPAYDGTTEDQVVAGAVAPFFCHSTPDDLCAGWVGCHDMRHNLAIRFSREPMDYDAIMSYESPVPLFASGAEAAEHGKRDMYEPGEEACQAIGKLQKIVAKRGK